MRYVSKCIPKQMRLQPLPENVGTERRVSEVVRQRVPGHLYLYTSRTLRYIHCSIFQFPRFETTLKPRVLGLRDAFAWVA